MPADWISARRTRPSGLRVTMRWCSRPSRATRPLCPARCSSTTSHRVLFGAEAIDAYIGQTEGRLMRALKTIFGSPLIDEKTSLGYRLIPLTEVVEIFVRHLKHGRSLCRRRDHGRRPWTAGALRRRRRRGRCEAQDGARSHRAPGRFRDVIFVSEPIAAACHYEQTVNAEELVLIADIGGGTSDFSVIRIGPERRGDAPTAATTSSPMTAGVFIGGTDFDSVAQPQCGNAPALASSPDLISKNLPMPKSLYFELATWSTINFAYGRKNEREVKELVDELARAGESRAAAQDPEEQRLGHRIAFAVEDAKIALSDQRHDRVSPSRSSSPTSRRKPHAPVSTTVIHNKTYHASTTLAASCIPAKRA